MVTVTVLKETNHGESRVALIPANVSKLVKAEMQVVVESGAGLGASHSDAEYEAAGATIAATRSEALANASVVLTLSGRPELIPDLKAGQTLVGMMDPLGSPEFAKELADAGIHGIAMELIPRITRAQSMDVLSSNATIAGYKAALMGAAAAPQLFPLMMTAAGTLKPARVFVMGVGVAGLQACATAKRLGAIVDAYDIRPAAQEQIIAVGARPVELKLETQDSESSGGYAKEQTPEFIARQQAAMADVLAQQDVVITTAAIPGRRAPVLITTSQLEQMKPGTVIVDLAAETGGNCELTRLGETVLYKGITILGPRNVASTVPKHASQMFGTNVASLLGLMVHEGALHWDFEDEIVRNTCVSYEGEVYCDRLRDLLSLGSLKQHKAAKEKGVLELADTLRGNEDVARAS